MKDFRSWRSTSQLLRVDPVVLPCPERLVLISTQSNPISYKRPFQEVFRHAESHGDLGCVDVAFLRVALAGSDCVLSTIEYLCVCEHECQRRELLVPNRRR